MIKNKSIDMALHVGAKTLHEGRRSAFEKGQKYIATFLNPETGMLRDEYLENRKCPVCDSDDAIEMFVKNGGTYVRCKSCSMVYFNPVFTDPALNTYYKDNTDAQADITAKESTFYRSIYTHGLANIGNITKPGDILDIGCSSGFFLDISRDFGWKTTGIELNLKEAATAKNKGHRIFTVPIDQANLGENFDVIALWDVFEHIKDGSTFLQVLRGHLAPQGIIFMQIPNSESLAARILHERCNMFDGIEHVNLYAPTTIKRLAEKSDFEVAYMESVISEIPVINNYLHYDDPYYGSVPTANSILNILDEQQLHANYLGYKLQIVLRKK